MDEDIKETIDSLAGVIRTEAQELEINTFLSFLYTAEIVGRYVDMEISRHTLDLNVRNLSRAAYNVLDMLILNGGSMIPTNISKRIYRSKHTITKIIDTLEKWGLVVRKSDGTDRRMRAVFITAEGVDLIKKTSVAESKRIISNEVLSSLSQEQIEELGRILRLIRKNVNVLIKAKESPGHSAPDVDFSG